MNLHYIHIYGLGALTCHYSLLSKSYIDPSLVTSRGRGRNNVVGSIIKNAIAITAAPPAAYGFDFGIALVDETKCIASLVMAYRSLQVCNRLQALVSQGSYAVIHSLCMHCAESDALRQLSLSEGLIERILLLQSQACVHRSSCIGSKGIVLVMKTVMFQV
jgi:hypothetical protein